MVIAVVCFVVYLSGQSRLPAPEHALIIGVRSSRQATAKAPHELTLASGARITVSPQDVHDAATLYVREVLRTQAWQPVAAERLFVLQIRSFTPVGKSHVDVTLHSGAVVRVGTTDIGDPQLTYLRTALAEKVMLERADQQMLERADQNRVRQDYARIVGQKILEKWQPPGEGAAGKVTMQFVIRRDGRITGIEVKESGGEILDLAAMRALLVTGHVPPVPRELPDDTVTILLVFAGRH
jgi:TonB family protein